ncbi:MAG: glycogen/starch/alpha-glucan phosphorylase [Oscillospiraceae bacterium]|nr:glycogen/starch/alpha-glucan phosphorylase [Oscillospiraceae bacterium]
MNCFELLQQTEALLRYTRDATLQSANAQQLHDCLGQAVMLAISDGWRKSKSQFQAHRKACYFSAEYLIGRQVYSNLYNLGILDEMRRLFAEKGVDLAMLEDIEDAALGNGGLGRLAACFLESAASLDIPLCGYGLRYRFGLFKQKLLDCNQKELADDWSKYGDPWSFRRYSHTRTITFADQTVLAVPYDMPVIGYGTDNIGTLRLWQCEAVEELDFDAFNAQDYERALQAKNRAEDITRVLYPNDSTVEGKRLRIKQQYLLSSASLQDILEDFIKVNGRNFDRFSLLCAVQLNDTHPAMSIPELIRLLMREGLSFDMAFEIARKTFSYTNHTVMCEALEKWDLDLLRSVVPEICDILLRIESRLQEERPNQNLYLIRDNTVHMANLSVYMSGCVNGVAAIHTEILKHDLFRDWYAAYPERFQNKTNGITPRRWLGLCNPELTELIEKRIGSRFLKDLDQISRLKGMIDDGMIREFNEVKRKKKVQLCREILEKEGVELSPDSVFDVQVKRMHEYKRQLLNAFAIMDIYFALKEGKMPDFPRTVFLFGAKSAPGYVRAKAIIRYINEIALLINGDPAVNQKIQVVFVQNYNCSYAEKIIPAADISEQISPAGTEASGTGNMKLMLNGAVTLGTMDGANVEIMEQAGQENNFPFGASVEDLRMVRDTYRARDFYEGDSRIHRVVDTLVDGTVRTDGEFAELYHALLDGASWHRADNYFLLLDFRNYLDTKLRAIYTAKDREAFARMCLMNVASAGKFSSDRTIRQYATEIWHI